jgi:hypothetical protein
MKLIDAPFSSCKQEIISMLISIVFCVGAMTIAVAFAAWFAMLIVKVLG